MARSYLSSPPHLREKLTEIIHQEESGLFSSHCPEYQVASMGETELEASRMLADAVCGLFEVGETPRWDDAAKERREIEEMCADHNMTCVYDGPLRH